MTELNHIDLALATWDLFWLGPYPTRSMRCIALYGLFARLGTCHVWVRLQFCCPRQAQLNESSTTTKADGIACGIVGRLGKGWDNVCGKKVLPCGGVPALPSGNFCYLVVIQACTGLPIKDGPTVNPKGSSSPTGLSLFLPSSYLTPFPSYRNPANALLRTLLCFCFLTQGDLVRRIH